LIATDDKMIPPPAQRFMPKRAGSTVVEVAGSHAIYVSQPGAVAKLIEDATKEVGKKIGFEASFILVSRFRGKSQVAQLRSSCRLAALHWGGSGLYYATCVTQTA
jgi:hypothetical protein